MESIIVNKNFLKALAINDEAKASLDSAVRTHLLSEVFWDRVQGLLTLLKPVADAILSVEGDNKELSLVMKVFAELQNSFDTNLEKSPILKSEETLFKEIIPKRKKFLVRSVHLTANMLDPRYLGCHLSTDEQVRFFFNKCEKN